MSDLDPVTGRPIGSPTAPTNATTGEDRSGGDKAKAKASEATGQAKEKASAAGGAAGEHAGQVTESAKAHAHEVTDEARRQVSHLVDESRNQIRSTAGEQTDRVAGLLQGFSGQLEAMARGERAEGPLVDLAQEGAARIDELASRLRTGGPEMAIRDAQRFARRRPGMFLASAFGAGLLAGRLFRNTDTSKVAEAARGDSGGTSQGNQGTTNAEMELSRGGVPAPASTGSAGAGLPGAPSMVDADPLKAGDPTGVQGGPR